MIRKTLLLTAMLIVLMTISPKVVIAPMGVGIQTLDLARASLVHVSRGEPEQKIERRVMRVTAYSAGKESTGKTPASPTYGQTAISTPAHRVYAKEWYTIAAPPDVPIGTQIYIPFFADKPNKGIFVVEDRGGGIKDNKLDVYFGDPAKDKTVLPRAYEFGVQELEVLIRY